MFRTHAETISPARACKVRLGQRYGSELANHDADGGAPFADAFVVQTVNGKQSWGRIARSEEQRGKGGEELAS